MRNTGLAAAPQGTGKLAEEEDDEPPADSRQLPFNGWSEADLKMISKSPQASVQRIARVLDLLAKTPGQPVAYTDIAKNLHLSRGELQGALSGFTRWIRRHWGDDDGWPMTITYGESKVTDQASEGYCLVTPQTAQRWLAVRAR